jgi:hypothetical protein
VVNHRLIRSIRLEGQADPPTTSIRLEHLDLAPILILAFVVLGRTDYEDRVYWYSLASVLTVALVLGIVL